jgi:hypothetical protein
MVQIFFKKTILTIQEFIRTFTKWKKPLKL